MKDYCDKILNLQETLRQEIIKYVKKIKTVELCDTVLIYDGLCEYFIDTLIDDGDDIILIDNENNTRTYLSDIMNVCIFDLYLVLFDCCVKNS